MPQPPFPASRACSEPGTPICGPDGVSIIECDEEGSIRLVRLCSGGCEFGTCLPVCNTRGTTWCDGGQPRVCETTARSRPLPLCEDELRCINGDCVRPTCEVGATCLDERTVLLCASGGAYLSAIGCAEDQLCEDGRCVFSGVNACGGDVALDAAPGTICGPCLRDVWECASEVEVTCSGETTNSCGGCTDLPGIAGEPCGDCGTWTCEDGETMVCADQGFNACGGCERLSNAPRTPCGPCGLDRYACEDGLTVCSGETTNGCGGCAAIENTPGESCGDCGTGSWVCQNESETLCVEVPGCRPPGFGVGDFHTCAARGNGRGACWGANDRGQLGNGQLALEVRTPTTIFGVDNANEFAGGSGHTCMRTDNASIACWGANADGQVGNDSRQTRLFPFATPSLLRIRAISAGDRHTCLIRITGDVRCWGANDRGQLGLGDNDDRLTITTLPNINQAAGLVVGANHTCIRSQAGDVYCWGANDRGQLGLDDNEDRDVPTRIELDSPAITIGGGRNHVCAALEDGRTLCWGANGSGQLGDASRSDSATPVEVVTDEIFLTIRGGARHTCAIVAGRRNLLCWGDNAEGQLGDGTRTTSEIPVRIEGLENVLQIGLGAVHSCAMREDGNLFCWGGNQFGQLTGSATRRTTPTPIVW